MATQKSIKAYLETAFHERKRLSIDLYVEVLADFENEMRKSLNDDADDALLCVLADDGKVAMLMLDWDGSIYRNEHALAKLKAMWRQSFDANVERLLPVFTEHIARKNLGVAGIKLIAEASRPGRK